MTEHALQGIELLPASGPVRQLFILLHGVGGTASDLLPLAEALGAAFPQAAYLLPDGFAAFDAGASGRQWFSIDGVTEDNRATRVAEAMPALHALVRQAQDRFKVMQPDTALAGFSQGAIMALEYAIAHDGSVGRVLAFSGRFATLPDKAPELTTLHLLHGKDDRGSFRSSMPMPPMNGFRNVRGTPRWTWRLLSATTSMPPSSTAPCIACRHAFRCAPGSMR